MEKDSKNWSDEWLAQQNVKKKKYYVFLFFSGNINYGTNFSGGITKGTLVVLRTKNK